MTQQEVDQYRITAKVGDRIGWRTYQDVWHVGQVTDRGVVVGLRKDGSDHRHLIDFSVMQEYRIIHKEP